MIKRPIHLSHDFLAEVMDKSSVVVDATMGNGNDTAFWHNQRKKFMLLMCKNKLLEKQVSG